jgi:hypothetical protein
MARTISEGQWKVSPLNFTWVKLWAKLVEDKLQRGGRLQIFFVCSAEV